MMKYEIRNRFTGAEQFTAEIDCANDASTSLKIGLSVRWAIKSHANLSGADLSGADLSRADLSRANLSGAYLSDAYLSRADLSDANLSRANLSGAYLSRADLSDADLSRANLSRADLSDAKSVVDLGYPNGWRAVGWWSDGAPWVRVGCRTKSLADGRAYWAGNSDRREVMAALDYFEAVSAIRADEKSEAA